MPNCSTLQPERARGARVDAAQAQLMFYTLFSHRKSGTSVNAPTLRLKAVAIQR